MKQEITYEIAHAASVDAGNRSMRAAGRKIWNVDDYNASVAEFNRLMPEENENANHASYQQSVCDRFRQQNL
jgi:hypothetical protein